MERRGRVSRLVLRVNRASGRSRRAKRSRSVFPRRSCWRRTSGLRRTSIKRRLERCRLELHPEKTTIVYCKDDDRKGGYPKEKFNFLGYTFALAGRRIDGGSSSSTSLQP